MNQLANDSTPTIRDRLARRHDFGSCPAGHRFSSRDDKVDHARVNMPMMSGEGAELTPPWIRYRQREWRRSA
jgi:hypothetical protein